jgi:hypothetical protein
MSVYSQRQVIRLCARRGWHNCMITLPICRSMWTSGGFGREHTLWEFDSLVLSGTHIPFGCFDPSTPSNHAFSRFDHPA